jgi:hypothetical protein
MDAQNHGEHLERGMDEVLTLKQARLEARVAVADRLRLTTDSARWLEWEADRVIDAFRQAVEAHGGHIEIQATFPDVVIPLEHISDLDREPDAIKTWFRLTPF